MVNQIIKTVCIHLHRAYQEKCTTSSFKYHKQVYTGMPMVQYPMAKRPLLNRDFHKQRPRVLEAQTFLSSLLTTQVNFTNPKFIHRTRGSATSLHGRNH